MKQANDEAKNKKHHVAWADRIGLNKQWGMAIHDCREAYGTDEFSIKVRIFKLLLINIKNGPQLTDIVNSYIDNDLKHSEKEHINNMIINNPYMTSYHIKDQRKQIEYINSELLFHYMIQLLEDNGFCFYESSVEEDEMI